MTNPYPNQIITLPNGEQLKHHELCHQLYEMGYPINFMPTELSKKEECELISEWKFYYNQKRSNNYGQLNKENKHGQSTT